MGKKGRYSRALVCLEEGEHQRNRQTTIKKSRKVEEKEGRLVRMGRWPTEGKIGRQWPSSDPSTQLRLVYRVQQ